MYITSLWPERAALGLSKHVYNALINNLTTPFESIEQAQSFWDEGACQLIHINPSELSMLDEQQWLCMTEPDFIDVLADYSLHCRITNDIGGGLFILIKNN